MRKLFKMALAAMMCLTLVACGNSGNGGDDAKTDGVVLPAEGTTVTIWHTFTDDQLTTLEAIAKDFNDTNEYGITVKVESQAYSGFLDSVKTAVYNGVGPDMILNYASAAADYVIDEKVVDLSKYINDENIGIPNYATSKPAGIYEEESAFEDGQQHIIITQTTGPIVFYNKTLYDELGLTPATTWAELAANAKTVTEKTGKTGFAFDSLTDTIQALIIQSGSGYIDTDAKEVLWNNDKVIEQIDYIANGAKEGYFAVTPTNNYFSNDMNSGQVAAYIGSVAGLPYIIPDGWEVGCSPMPLEGNKWNPAWDRGLMVFNYEDENRAVASYLFIKHFIETENSLKWNMAMNSLSPFFAVQEQEVYKEYLASNEALAALAQQMDTSGVLPTITGSATVRTELESAVKTVALGNKTAADALQEAADNSNKALQE